MMTGVPVGASAGVMPAPPPLRAREDGEGFGVATIVGSGRGSGAGGGVVDDTGALGRGGAGSGLTVP